MTTNFYFHSLKVENFRAFTRLNIDKLKRINIIGGFNGVGKSALLETLFFVLDRRNPIALMKPMQWRRLETQSSIDPIQFLKNPEKSEAHISTLHRGGATHIDLTYQLPPANISVSIASSNPQIGVGVTEANQKGMLLRTYHEDRKTTDQSFFMPAQNGAIGNLSLVSNDIIPPGQLLSLLTRGAIQETATQLSNVIKQRKTDVLISAMRHLSPNLNDIKTLQDGNIPQIYADISGELIALQYLGDGFINLFNTILALMGAKDGVLFLDEIDAAIHYSKVPTIWSIISSMANEQNCQIFATTHSRECIFSAAEGIRQAGRSDDFQYLRLEKSGENHYAVHYSMDDLQDAESSSVEVR